MASLLVVDDDPISQRMLGFTLRRDGHQVISAADGEEALQRLAAEHFDLLIVDLTLPGMDGLTLLRHLRSDERYSCLPVIMLTASGQDEDRIRARLLGANDFLTKPTSSRELVERVNRLLG